MSMEEKMTYEMMLENEKRRKNRLLMMLILGIVGGFALKTEAAKRVTMGSNDYMVTQDEVRAYNLNEMQRTVIAQGGAAAPTDAPAAGGSCGQQ